MWTYQKLLKQRPNGSTRSKDHTQMTLFLNQNEHDNFSSLSQGNFQDRESLFHSFRIIKSNHAVQFQNYCQAPGPGLEQSGS